MIRLFALCLLASVAAFGGKSGTTIKSTGTVHTAPGVKRDSNGRIARSHTATATFQQVHACPSTGKKEGACPGYVIDHVKPLACGGADTPANMQWQSETAAKIKDRTERKGCH